VVGSLLGKNRSAVTHRGFRVKAVVAALSVAGVLLTGGCTGADDPPAPAPVPAPSGATVAPAPASTAVPAPTPGDVESTVKPGKVERRKPVALTKPATAADGVIITVSSVKSISTKAVGPGEVSGPGLQMEVAIRNTTSTPIDLAGTVVSVVNQDGRPGASMGGPPATRLPSQVAAQSQASAVFVFGMARGRRDPVTIDVNVGGTMPTVVFRGKADG